MQIGFGCASLGSRVSVEAGLRSLDRGYDAGIRWFDVAPSYGDGEAEAILGRFLNGKRESVSICTKVGILPPKPSLPKRMLRPVVRGVLKVAPQLRQAIRQHRPAAVKPPLDASSILPSLEASLRRLGTDRVDVLALHEAKPEEVARDDVLRAIEAVLQSGKALKISIASSVEAAVAGLNASNAYGVVQLANNPYERELSAFRAAKPVDAEVDTITHTVFGASGMSARLANDIKQTPALAKAMVEAGYSGSPLDQALAFLPDYAFATNSDGVVLMSMFGAGHLESALARQSAMPDGETITQIAKYIPA